MNQYSDDQVQVVKRVFGINRLISQIWTQIYNIPSPYMVNEWGEI